MEEEGLSPKAARGCRSRARRGERGGSGGLGRLPDRSPAGGAGCRRAGSPIPSPGAAEASPGDRLALEAPPAPESAAAGPHGRGEAGRGSDPRETRAAGTRAPCGAAQPGPPLRHGGQGKSGRENPAHFQLCFALPRRGDPAEGARVRGGTGRPPSERPVPRGEPPARPRVPFPGGKPPDPAPPALPSLPLFPSDSPVISYLKEKQPTPDLSGRRVSSGPQAAVRCHVSSSPPAPPGPPCPLPTRCGGDLWCPSPPSAAEWKQGEHVHC